MGDYRSLQVWKRAHLLALDVYSITRSFPPDERFGLVSQMRRSAVSIPANLAEGCGRASDREIARFSRIALGSASELEYYILLSEELGYIQVETSARLGATAGEVKMMLASLARSLTTSF